MRELIQFYAPGWTLFFIWCAIALPACGIVLWIGGLFGRRGALAAATVELISTLAFWLLVSATGPGLHLMVLLVVPPPLIVGALLGLVIWYVWLG